MNQLTTVWRPDARLPDFGIRVNDTKDADPARRGKAGNVTWPEVHGDTIIIPAARMKGKDGKAREHRVSLSSTAREIVAALPRYRGGPYPFSFSAGERPLSMASPIKRDLDRR